MTLQKIFSLQNPLVKHLRKLNTDRHYRKECRSAIIEGKILVHELYPTIKFKKILTTEISLLPVNADPKLAYIVTHEILKKISGTATPENILAEVELPLEDSLEGKKYLIALDKIQDPGNLGTIIRTALAFDWDGVFFLEGCCDPWNDKALRAAKGATFKLPFQSGTWENLTNLIKKNHLTALAADIEGHPPEHYTNLKKILLVLGNESKGLSIETVSHCQKVAIPMHHRQMESLNVSVAGGILMYTFKQSQEYHGK